MASISTELGVGSGLPLETLLTNLMTAESQPLVNLQAKEASVQNQISAFGQLSSGLSTLRDVILGLTDAKFNAGAATSSDKDVATVTAANNAANGTFSLEVIKLAAAQKAVSAPLANGDATVGSGQLTFTFGSVGADHTFTADPDFPVQNVTISSGDNTLTGMKDAINKANVGVRASVVNDGSGSRLVLTSTSSGAEKAFKITAQSDGAGTGTPLSQFAYDPSTAPAYDAASTTPGMSQLQAADDAEIKVDGLTITQSTNTITGAIDGVTINLLKVGTTQVGVSQDSSAASTSLQSLVTAYNTFLATANKLALNAPSTTLGDTNSTNGPLAGDSSVRNILNTMRNEIFAPMDGATGQYTSLASLGVSFQKDGTLKLDTDTFNSAMKADPVGVSKLFAPTPDGEGTQGLTARFAAKLTALTDKTGSIQSRVDGLTTTTKDLQNQETDLQRQLTQIEARYRAQFTALDTLVTGLNNTSTFLTQQLASLSNLN